MIRVRLVVLGVAAYAACGALAVAAALVVQPDPVQVIGRQEVFAPIWPMVAWIPSVGIGALVPVRPAWVRTSAEGTRRHALAHLSLTAVTLWALVVVSPPGLRAQMCVAVGVFGALGAVTAAATGAADGAWVPGLVVGLGMWLLGSTPLGPASWAVVYRSDLGAAGVAWGVVSALAGEAALMVRLELGRLDAATD